MPGENRRVLRKGILSAVVMSAAAVLAFSVVGALVNIGVPYWLSGDLSSIVADPDSFTTPGEIQALVEIVGFLELAMIVLGAIWLYRFFGESYYGGRGLARWALFGALFALLLKLPDWLLPSNWWIASLIWKFACVFPSFFLARKAIPVKRD